MKSSKAFLIFSGFNQRAVIAFCRSAIKNEIPFYIIAKSQDDSILKSKYASNVICIRENSNLEINQIVKTIKIALETLNNLQLIILPTTESLNRLLLLHREELEKLNCILPLVNKELYINISDKYSFGEICQKEGFDLPEEYNDYKNAEFPFVAKPYTYNGADNKEFLYPYIIKNQTDLNEFTKKEDTNNFYYQEYISGNSYYLLYYFAKQGDIIKYSQKNLIQQAEGKSIIAAVSDNLHLEEISDNYINLFKKLNYFGFLMIEIKFYNEKYYMIEANPRLWGPSQLFVDANIPIFEKYFEDYEFNVKIKADIQNNKSFYFWHGGMIENIKNGKTPAFHEYSQQEFLENQLSFTNCDIYNRIDTLGIYKNEMEMDK